MSSVVALGVRFADTMLVTRGLILVVEIVLPVIVEPLIVVGAATADHVLSPRQNVVALAPVPLFIWLIEMLPPRLLKNGCVTFTEPLSAIDSIQLFAALVFVWTPCVTTPASFLVAQFFVAAST